MLLKNPRQRRYGRFCNFQSFCNSIADSMPVFDSEHNNVGHLCSHSQKDPQGTEQRGKKTTTTKRLESLGLDLDYTHSHTACHHSLIPVVFWLLVQHGVLISHHSSHLNINTPIRPKGFLAATIHKPHTAYSKCVSLMHVHETAIVGFVMSVFI